MSSLFNEAEADIIVTANIAKYKRQLLIIEELDIMYLYKNNLGRICQVVSAEQVTREVLVERKDKLAKDLQEAEDALRQYDALKPAVPPLPQPAQQPATFAPGSQPQPTTGSVPLGQPVNPSTAGSPLPPSVPPAPQAPIQ